MWCWLISDIQNRIRFLVNLYGSFLLKELEGKWCIREIAFFDDFTEHEYTEFLNMQIQVAHLLL
jgi:hypothetical protein